MRTIVFGLLFSVARAFGQTPSGPAFEVASIKQAVFPSEALFAGFSSYGTCTVGRPKISGNRVSFQRVTLCGLIMAAYDVPGGQGFRVTGAPAWMMKPEQSVYYDVQAKAERDGVLSGEQARAMLRALLAERFQLKLHHGTKEMPVYALVVGKNSPKLSSESICDKSRFDVNRAAIGFKFCKPVKSMVDLAGALTSEMDRPVVDMTGLTGSYAFELLWVPEGRDGPRCSAAEEGCFNAPERDDAAIIRAVQDQLGLKLDARKAEVDVLIIDQAERPIAN